MDEQRTDSRTAPIQMAAAWGAVTSMMRGVFALATADAADLRRKLRDVHRSRGGHLCDRFTLTRASPSFFPETISNFEGWRDWQLRWQADAHRSHMCGRFGWRIQSVDATH